VNHLDAETGTIEVGKLADLAILDGDPFAPDAGPLASHRVIGTFVSGEAVFARPDLG
jgi:predicted amidohydrolase YtcJ